MSKAYNRNLAAVETGTVTKTEIIGIRKLINASERAASGWSTRVGSAVDLDELFELEETVRKVRPRIAGELHETGLKVLRNPRYAKRWEPWQREAIDALDHFRLADFDRIGRRGEYAVPVYEVWAKVPPKGDALDGGSYLAFRFRNIPWQSAMGTTGLDGPRIVTES